MAETDQRSAPASFEEAFRRLQETVSLLEQGELSLEESIRRFEKGMALATLCADILDKAELRVTTLVPEPEPGSPPPGGANRS